MLNKSEKIFISLNNKQKSLCQMCNHRTLPQVQ